MLELAEWQSIFQTGATPKGRRGMPETAYGTRAADGAARRACKRLAEQGHIELGYRSLKVGKVRPLTQPRGNAPNSSSGESRQPQNKGTRMPETPYATDHTDAAPTARDHETALRRQILAILPEIELFIIAFDCGLNPRSRRTKPALITWLLPHWREAEPHVFAFLDRAKHDSIREAWLGEGVDLPPVHPAETPEERARLLRKLTPRDRVMIENIVEQTGMTVAEACRRVDVIDGLPGYDAD